jgi:hypothetical protein
MKNIIENICRLWWIKARGNLTNPTSRESINALEYVLSEDLDFDDFVVEYILESVTGDNKSEDESEDESEDKESKTDDDKEKAKRDIQQVSLTQYEKEKLANRKGDD